MLLLFSLTYLLPGEPATIMLGPRATPEKIAELNQRLHLDAPAPQRLWIFISGAARGDLGRSVWSGHQVLDLILKNLPHTILLAFSSLGMASLLGIGLGAFASTVKGRWFDAYITGASLIAVAIPDFVAALILMLVFCIHLPLFPAIGGGEGGGILQIIYHLILPSTALAIGWIGFFARLSRESMLQVLDSDYIRTMQAFAVPRHRIVYKYALKNAVIPSITVIGLGMGKLLGGAVFIEVIFNRPGLGKLIVDAVYARDLPVIQGGIMVTTLLFIVTNILSDLSYSYEDPRIQYE